MISLLPFWVLNMSIVLLSMERVKALGFHQKSVPEMNEGLTGLERHEGE